MNTLENNKKKERKKKLQDMMMSKCDGESTTC